MPGFFPEGVRGLVPDLPEQRPDRAGYTGAPQDPPDSRQCERSGGNTVTQEPDGTV